MIVLDVGCYRELLVPATLRQVVASVRASGQAIWPSQANAFEIIKYDNHRRRNQLLTVLQELKGDRPLLLWPQDLLKRIAVALVKRETRFPVAPALVDKIIADPRLLKPEHVKEVRTFLETEEANMQQAAKQGRKAARAIIKARGGGKPFSSAQDFLSLWSDAKNLAWYIDYDLKSIELTVDEALRAALLANPEWRLHYDITGVAMYRQMMEPKEPRWVGRVDLGQVIYLGEADVLVSRDNAFLEAATDAVIGRYANKRIMSWQEFLALVG